MASTTPLLTLGAAGAILVALLAVNSAVATPGQKPGSPSASSPAGAATQAPDAVPTASTVEEPTDTDSSEAAQTTGAAVRDRSSSSEPGGSSDGTGRQPRMYVGHASPGGLGVALVVKGHRAVAYVCDGQHIEAWLSGAVDGSTIELRGADGGTLEVRRDGTRLTGWTGVSGRRYEFTLEPGRGPARLYRAVRRDGSVRAGWIVQSDGSQLGVRTERGATRPAPPMTPSQPVTLGGQNVIPTEVSGDEQS